MRALRTSTLVAVLLAATAGTALGADYPYHGYFATSLPDESLDDTRLSCANGFFRQGPDGSFVNYHLDAARYDSDGTIRYLRYGSGLCTLLADKRTEACKMAFSSDPEEIGAVYVDVVEAVEAGVLEDPGRLLDRLRAQQASRLPCVQTRNSGRKRRLSGSARGLSRRA